ncbi:MAG: hypothetical protein KQJ78_06865 [Deltaproteobacteria bacterium]|nr:hypothetical protein [Deltaproteobacteria bacterium]
MQRAKEGGNLSPINPAQAVAILARPGLAVLGDYLEARIALENNPGRPLEDPPGITRPVRPHLPKAGRAALALYMNRAKVDSYSLLFTTIALAHPN